MNVFRRNKMGTSSSFRTPKKNANRKAKICYSEDEGGESPREGKPCNLIDKFSYHRGIYFIIGKEISLTLATNPRKEYLASYVNKIFLS